MANNEWKQGLARTLAGVTSAVGALCLIARHVILVPSPDILTWYLSAYVLSLLIAYRLNIHFKYLAMFMVLNMNCIALLLMSGLTELVSSPVAVMVSALAVAAVYYGLTATIIVMVVTLVAFIAVVLCAPLYLPAGQNPGHSTLLAAQYAFVEGLSFVGVGSFVSILVRFVIRRFEREIVRANNLLTSTRHQKETLEEKERLLTLFTELSSDYVYQINLQKPDLVPEIIAGSFHRTTGYTIDALREKGGWMSVIHADDRERMENLIPRILASSSFISEYRIVSGSGKIVWLQDNIKTVRDEKGDVVLKLLGAVHDITQRKVAEGQIEMLAFYDPLTALPNRRLLLDRLEQALALSGRTKLWGAILFIDLDHFKNLNDTQGHEAGDQLLVQQSRRLAQCVRDGDTVARLGGDEFIVILHELSEAPETAAESVTQFSQKVIETLSKPVALTQKSTTDYENTCSIGVSMFLGHDFTMDELMRHADLALYQAKADGRNTFRFFDPGMQRLLTDRLTLEEDLKQALAQNQFRIYLQPQVLSNGTMIGAEVLLRWEHPTKGLLTPGSFIAAAEQTGAILEIGTWVLEQSCNLLRRWSGHDATQDLKIAINFSAKQFKQGECAKIISSMIEKTGANPHRLELELTESLAIDNIDDTVIKMRALRKIGVGISLDDFGTGHSSLSYLKQLPLTQIKIDQSFVRDITTDASDAILVQTIIGMANNLGLEIIAEGVETEEQRAFLEKNGCSLFQGYFFAKPMSVDDIERNFKLR